MLKPLIGKLVDGTHLSEVETMDAMEHIMGGRASDGQVGAFLAALRLKGETTDELVGAARVMRRHATPLTPPIAGLVDTCGTGGDASRSFNISTAAAFVLAGAGLSVAKHGNRAVSSHCGSADVLQALGVRIEVDIETTRACIEEIGVGFLYAPMVHAAMRHVAPLRRDIGVRTMFNLLGPLTNPAAVAHQVVGVCRPEYTRLLAEALLRLGTHGALIVHGLDGLDEMTISAPTHVSEVREGAVTEYVVAPEDAGLERAPLETIRGGDERVNADIVRRLLAGERSPRRDVVLLNAAAALFVSGVARDLHAGVRMATLSIDSGAAREKLDRLAHRTNRAHVARATT
ncbi:MAG: anthranilate phosphoribosyltransferase [Thermoleophilia bacterium]